MATKAIGIPWGIPNGANAATTPDDMQLITAALFEAVASSGLRGGILRTWGVETRPDTTLRVHEGAVVLDIGANRSAIVALPYIASLDPGLAAGTAGTVTVYVAPPASGAATATVNTTTSTTINPSWVVLDRLAFPAGWVTTSEATSIADLQFAVLQGTSQGMRMLKRDVDAAVRVKGQSYTKCAGTFHLDTDAAATFHVSSTIRACDANGVEVNQSGSVVYELWVDGTRMITWEREVNKFATTTSWEATFNLTRGDHDAHLVSRFMAQTGTWTPRWQVIGDEFGRLGDGLRVVEGGGRR